MLRIFVLKSPKTKNQNPSTYGCQVFVDYKKTIILAKEITSYSTLLSNYKAII